MRGISNLIVVLVFILLSTSIFATRYVFIGKGAWSDPGNWEGKMIPPHQAKAGDTIIINGNAITTAACCANDFESNRGVVIISQGGSLTLQNATQFSNIGGTFTILGSLINKTNFEVYKKSIVTISGSLTNQLWIGNQGNLTVNGGTITNTANLDNDMGIKTGEIIVNCGGSIINASSGKFYIGNSTLKCGTQIINSGIVSGTPKKG
ncbi:MAG TPA: hypothetical protein VK588_05600 [Chitinophagaceae bacterium]|nr:hypothetical protein [Chitinophagaceae bacterium]